jgi:hypothetical protein
MRRGFLHMRAKWLATHSATNFCQNITPRKYLPNYEVDSSGDGLRGHFRVVNCIEPNKTTVLSKSTPIKQI